MRNYLAAIVASLANSGTGKIHTHLINRISEAGRRVNLLAGDPNIPCMDRLHSSVQAIEPGTSSTITGVLSLAWYLLREKSETLLARRIRVNVLVLRARNLVHARPASS